jgi:hypothetical protein
MESFPSRHSLLLIDCIAPNLTLKNWGHWGSAALIIFRVFSKDSSRLDEINGAGCFGHHTTYYGETCLGDRWTLYLRLDILMS